MPCSMARTRPRRLAVIGVDPSLSAGHLQPPAGEVPFCVCVTILPHATAQPLARLGRRRGSRGPTTQLVRAYSFRRSPPAAFHSLTNASPLVHRGQADELVDPRTVDVLGGVEIGGEIGGPDEGVVGLEPGGDVLQRFLRGGRFPFGPAARSWCAQELGVPGGDLVGHRVGVARLGVFLGPQSPCGPSAGLRATP